MIMVVYEENSTNYRLLSQETMKVSVARHVKFNEAVIGSEKAGEAVEVHDEEEDLLLVPKTNKEDIEEGNNLPREPEKEKEVENAGDDARPIEEAAENVPKSVSKRQTRGPPVQTR